MDAQRLRVWDLPTRVFHWTLAVTVVAAIVTAHMGGNAMNWHFRLGELVLALLAFRVVWGFVGGHWSRFSSFLYPPAALTRYLQRRPLPQDRFDVGHSPLGSLSVWALLALLVAQVATGLVADDEISNVGPLNRFVESRTASLASHWHADIGQWILIALIVLHVLAVFVYARRGRRLVGPMWHGDKPRDPAWPADLPAARDSALVRLTALALFGLALAGAAWVASLGG